MKEDLLKYFENLEETHRKNKGGVVSLDKKNTEVYDLDDHFKTKRYGVIIDGKHYFAKGISDVRSIAEIASSRMYNEIGIPTPPVNVVELPKQGVFQRPQNVIINPNVRNIKGLQFTSATDFFRREDVTRFVFDSVNSKFKWAPLYDNSFRRFFEQYMTRECYDQLIALMLADELRSERDRHTGNYFFYKKKDSNIFEGVIPIDNEMMAIADSERFEDFLYVPYTSPTITGISDKKDYASRVRDIKDLIQDGVLSESQIALIRRELDFDLDKVAKEVGKKSVFRSDRKKAYDLISELTEYNRNEIGKEL